MYSEIPDFDLLQALQNGLLPSHYGLGNPKRALASYIADYLKEEIYAESLTRNLPAFARFLDAVAFSHGELINYSNIARDCGVDSKTIKEYYQILEDTLLGYFLPPYHQKGGRDTISQRNKFYLFDVGVAGHLCQRQLVDLQGAAAGQAFEHYIFMELVAYRSLMEKEFELGFWRTEHGLEVDFIIGQGEVAIEVKISNAVRSEHLKGLRAFVADYHWWSA